MQRDTTISDERTNEPDYALASYGRRVGAWALDFVGVALPLFLLFLTQVGLFFIPLLFLRYPYLHSWLHAGLSNIIVTALIYVVLAGYIVWWLFALGRGQTPGKQIVGIRVIKDDGSPSGWGYTFLREFVIKFLLLGFLSRVTFGISQLVDYLWPLWDRSAKMQTLHDKLLGTLVVCNPR